MESDEQSSFLSGWPGRSPRLSLFWHRLKQHAILCPMQLDPEGPPLGPFSASDRTTEARALKLAVLSSLMPSRGLR